MTTQIQINKLTLLENNPRVISEEAFKQLLNSIQADPHFLEDRPILAYPQDGKLIVYAGNQRLRACMQLGWEEVPVRIAEDVDIDTIRRRILLDNIEFGKWDKETLANNYDIEELKLYDLPEINQIIEEVTPIDYSILNNTDQDIDQRLNDMSDGVKKSIQIEFTPEDYDYAYKLCQEARSRNIYIGEYLINMLKDLTGVL